MKSLVEAFGDEGKKSFEEFAAMAGRYGYRNWERHAAEGAGSEVIEVADNPGEPRLVGIAPLMIRLRSAFGVNTKSDVLTELIAGHEDHTTVSEMSRLLGYTKVAVRNSLNDMVAAGLVQEVGSHPARYSTRREAWSVLFHLCADGAERVHLHDWRGLFAFIVRSYKLMDDAGRNEHVRASLARDLAGSFNETFLYNGIPVPEPARYPGRAYAEAFSELCHSVADWIGAETDAK